MLYYFFEFLEHKYQFPGSGLYQFLSFRAAVAMIISLTFSLVFGQRIINYLSKLQIGESVRDLGLDGQKEKTGTPTMGGLIIIFSTIIPVILLAKLENIYIIILLITSLWMGLIGGIDDYIKVFKKNYVEDLYRWQKIIGVKDPFGDFDLIFSAAYSGQKIVELPINYKERRYGTTQISRFKDGYKLLLYLFASFRIFNTSR